MMVSGAKDMFLILGLSPNILKNPLCFLINSEVPALRNI